MLLVRVKSGILPKVRNSVVRIKKRECSVSAITQNEDTEPQYPRIIDHSFEARFRRNRDEQAESIAKTRTIEEKMIKLNMPRYYGYNSFLLEEFQTPYNALDQMQYITKTHILDEPGLPSYYDNVITPEKLQEKVEKIKGSIEDSLVFEYSSKPHFEEPGKTASEMKSEMKNMLSKAVSKQVNRTLVSNLASEYPHLLESEVAYDPRIEAFWFAGGLPVPLVDKIRRKAEAKRRNRAVTKFPEDYENYPVDRYMQYIGKPDFQLRHTLPLPEIIPISESENPDFKVPVFKYCPRVLGYMNVRRHGTNIPGFWPGETTEFGFLSYHNSGYLWKRQFDDIPDVLRVQAVLGSWGWLLAQACNLGFSTFNEVTYPLVNQMIITNGKWWTFCVYQLNTTIVHTFYADENPRRNLCWMSKPMKLFDKIENNQVHGLNTEVLENLVKFYVNEPRVREGVEMKPFLQNGGEGLICNITGNMRRVWLEERFKLLQSNRPRHRRLPEIFQWEQIYLRKFKTIPMHKKRRPWEFGINMWHRKLDDHCPRYIPRPVRGSKHNPKWEKMYYPR